MEFLDLQGEIAVVVKLREDRRGLRLAARQTQGLERGVQLGDVDVAVPIIIEVVERRAHVVLDNDLVAGGAVAKPSVAPQTRDAELAR